LPPAQSLPIERIGARNEDVDLHRGIDVHDVERTAGQRGFRRGQASASYSGPSEATNARLPDSSRSATMSTSFVERGWPCTELANEPPMTYAMPSRSKCPATAAATLTGSGNASGVTLFGAVDAAHQVVAETHPRQFQEKARLGRMRVTRAKPRQRHPIRCERYGPQSLGFLGERHRRVASTQELSHRRCRIVYDRVIGHTGIYSGGR
jgi:hypothetical protein